jgi:hypothetical protein
MHLICSDPSLAILIRKGQRSEVDIGVLAGAANERIGT